MEIDIATIVPAISALLGVLITNGFHILNSKRAAKQKYYEEIIEIRHKAYARLYSKINEFQEYFMMFMEYDNELTISEERSNFQPLATTTALVELISEVELWIHQDTIILLKELKEDGARASSLAITFHGDDSDMASNLIEEISTDIYKKSEELKKHLREIIGINAVDDITNSMRKRR